MKGGLGLNRQLVSQQDSAITQRADVPRSTFKGSWTRKTTFDAPYLIPFLLDEILPGDHMRYNVTAYVRMSTPLFPIFDNQRVDTFFFFVPLRILWDNFVKMMGEQNAPGDSIEYTIPQLLSTVGGYEIGTIFDYFGLPTLEQIPGANQVTHSSLPLRAYNKIYNAWFRDENINNPMVERTGDSGDLLTDFEIQRRAKAHDYFTSALPWPQKFTAPTIPLLGQAPVSGIGALENSAPSFPATDVYQTETGLTSWTRYKQLWDNAASNQAAMLMDPVTGLPMIYADLSEATGVAINQLRQAWMVQSLLERDARGGTRYGELVLSHFGVSNPDSRLQRPEYIGGGQSPLNITPIAQTSPTTDAPLGALGAAGTSAGSHSASYAATEHGYIIGLINIRSELSYSQGLHKMWSRLTRYDFYWPALAGLGEQAILRKEIYVIGDTPDDTVFGYQERWHEYRTRVSETTGMFRPGITGTLDMWHLGEHFASAPVLNSTFIEERPPMARILAAGEEAANQQYLADILIQRTATRPIPAYGTPVMLGRF